MWVKGSITGDWAASAENCVTLTGYRYTNNDDNTVSGGRGCPTPTTVATLTRFITEIKVINFIIKNLSQLLAAECG